MKTRFCICLTLLFALGHLLPCPSCSAAYAADFNETALCGGISSDGTAYVTLSPVEGGLVYALFDREPTSDDLLACDWRAFENGAVTWDSLMPSAQYYLLFRPAESDVEPEQLAFLAPAPLPACDALSREPDSEPLFDRLILSSSDPCCEYALVSPDDLTIPMGELDWLPGGDTPIIYESLAFDQEYTLLARSFSLSPDMLCVPSSVVIPILPDVVLSSRLSASVDAQGFGYITVTNGGSNIQYAALKPDGTVAALLDGSHTPLTLSGLLPGREYLVTARASTEPLIVGDTLPVRGTVVSVPALYSDLSLSAGFGDTPDALFVQLNPACPAVSYAILGDNGQPVPDIRAFDGSGAEIPGNAGWFRSADSLRFESLLPGSTCSLALRDDHGAYTVLCDFTLPQNLPVLQKSEVSLTADRLSFPGVTGVQYALTDAGGLTLVSDWQGGQNQPLTFSRLTAGQTYRLILRTEDGLPAFCFVFTPVEETPTPPPQPVPPSLPSIPSGGAPTLPDNSKENGDTPASSKAPAAAGAERLLVTERRIAYIAGEPNGRCRPDDPLTRAEMCMLFYRLLREAPDAPAASYTDVAEGAWYFTPVSTLAALGIVQGDGEGRFLPDALITRAEFSAMAARFCLPAEAAFDFSDLTPEHWAYSFACTACANGWLTTDETGSFHPEKPLSRGEAVYALNLILGRSPDPETLEAQSIPPVFSDLRPESPWYYDIWEAVLSDSSPSSDLPE